MLVDDIKRMIVTGLPGAEVHITGDGRHFEAQIIHDDFAGKTMLQQHKMVYATLGDKMGGDIHALSMRTYTREQWEQAQSS
ncbi:MAG TPA: BolA/IbaG family iron-sulfur metabolism protein [Gammaproteobacteria bacterium]|nr:BolA/IbaG family iron-sulfur metabolism protein [Gammaproteobacteria bacterium]